MGRRRAPDEASPIREDVSLLDAVHDNVSLVTDIGYDMQSLANALSRVGHDVIAEEIAGWIEPLRRAAKQIQASYNLDMNGQLRHGEVMLGGLLAVGMKMAALEGERG